MLSSDEKRLISEMEQQLTRQRQRDQFLLAYFEGAHKLDELGISIPSGMDVLQVVVNWPRVAVEAIVERSDVKNLRRTGQLDADDGLMELFDVNNLPHQVPMFVRDKLIYGRSCLSVGSNEADPAHPLITVEAPSEMYVKIDKRTRRVAAALKVIRGRKNAHQQVFDLAGVLYLPNVTVWLNKTSSGWVEYWRDEHRMGRVPVVMCLNRQMTGSWAGRSEMRDVISITDAAVRTLTNLQFAVEAAAVPRKFVVGASNKDFVDADGNPQTKWEAYMSSVWALVNKDAKVGQLAGADLTGFHATVDMYGRLAASVTGYPVEYFGIHAANPPAEGAIRANEARLVKAVERSNVEAGTALGEALDIAEYIRTLEWPTSGRVRVEWQDPGTPTFAQKADALQKLAGGKPLISREGAWEELGWNEARMERERDRFMQELADPTVAGFESKELTVG